MANKHINDAPHPMSLGEYKLKQQDTTTHLLELCVVNTTNAGEDVEQQRVLFFTGGNTVIWWLLTKLNILPTQSSNCTP